MRLCSLAVLAGLAGLAALPTGSGAQTAAPTPCIGYAVEDPTGDAYYGFAGNFSPVPADPMLDVTGIFFRGVDKKFTMNIQIAELGETAPASTAGVVYRTIYTNPEDLYLDVAVDPTGAATASYGHFDPTPVLDGETPVKLYPGPNGVIEVVLPSGYGKGQRMSAYLFSAQDMGAVLASSDDVPDGSAGGGATFSYNGASCTGDDAPPGGGGSTPPPPGANQPLGQVSVKATPTKLKRKKAKKGRKLTFTVTPSERLTDATVSVNKGSKAFGSVKAATLEGATKVKLKLKKSLKKGSYQLAVNGTRADGSKGAGSVKLKVK